MRRILATLSLTALAPLAYTSQNPATAPGQGAAQAQGAAPLADSRAAMWFAPTAEDWKKPVLITFQRNFDDAIALSEKTGKPILVCVNMDGEIASEHYAGVRYRMPDIAKLYDPYVCVIASVYRHNPRDYDEQGNRILCPRFGSVTCGEHIWIEPVLYEKYFEGQRVAPRHICLELDRKETYDVYYAWDTDSVFRTIREEIVKRDPNLLKQPPGDLSLLDRVDSTDIVDRMEVERVFRVGDQQQKKAILEATARAKSGINHDLLRLALNGLDVDVVQLGRKALATSNSEKSIDLINEALRAPMEATERDALIAALMRIGDKAPRARTLAKVHQGLSAASTSIDVEAWTRNVKYDAAPQLSGDNFAIESKLTDYSKDAAKRPDDPEARTGVAESMLEFALNLKTNRKNSMLLFQDALNAAEDARKLGAKGWRVDSVAAVAEWYLGNIVEAREHAESAVRNMPDDANTWSAMLVLTLFADARKEAISKAVREGSEWPREWLADVNSAYSILARHPRGNDSHIASHFDFVRWLGAAGPAARVLDAGLARFPESVLLHDRLRTRILDEKGVEGLEPAYEEMLAKSADADQHNLAWFAGYAAMVAAEFHKKAGALDKSSAAYNHAIALFERNITKNETSRESSDHYIAMAFAGRAANAFEQKKYQTAVDDILASLRRREDAANALDGLNRSTVTIAKLVLQKLEEEKQRELAVQLDKALKSIDPILLLPPAYDTPGAPSPSLGSRPARQRRTGR